MMQQIRKGGYWPAVMWSDLTCKNAFFTIIIFFFIYLLYQLFPLRKFNLEVINCETFCQVMLLSIHFPSISFKQKIISFLKNDIFLQFPLMSGNSMTEKRGVNFSRVWNWKCWWRRGPEALWESTTNIVNSFGLQRSDFNKEKSPGRGRITKVKPDINKACAQATSGGFVEDPLNPTTHRNEKCSSQVALYVSQRLWIFKNPSLHLVAV